MDPIVLGRRVYADVTNDHGVEGALREALSERCDSLDEFDRLGFAVAFGLAWAYAASGKPARGDAELADLATRAADLSLRAEHTSGGWEAMMSGASPALDEWFGAVRGLAGLAG